MRFSVVNLNYPVAHQTALIAWNARFENTNSKCAELTRKHFKILSKLLKFVGTFLETKPSSNLKPLSQLRNMFFTSPYLSFFFAQNH